MPATSEDNRLLAVLGAVVFMLLSAGLICGLLVWQFSTQSDASSTVDKPNSTGDAGTDNSTQDPDRAAADAIDDQLAGKAVTQGRPPLAEMPELGAFEPEEEPELGNEPDNASTLSVRPYSFEEVVIPPYDPPLVPGAELDLPEDVPVVSGP